jgi:putative ABC transport system substrate-binding protein
MMALAAALASTRVAAQKKIPTIGIFGMMGPGAVAALKEGLRDQGLTEGQTITIVGGPATDPGPEAMSDRLAELLATPVDLIFVSGTSVRLVKNATKTVPIVMTTADPLASGIVESIARPGGNITGLSVFPAEGNGKRLELLSRLVPDLRRVGIVLGADDVTRAASLEVVGTAAAKLNIEPSVMPVRSEADLPDVFAQAMQAKAQALLLIPYPLLDYGGAQIAGLSLQHRVPVMSFNETYPKAGGLISYGSDVRAIYRRAAYYIARILAGTPPGELPIELPSKFNLVINLKTAKSLDLQVSDALLTNADQVIE